MLICLIIPEQTAVHFVFSYIKKQPVVCWVTCLSFPGELWVGVLVEVIAVILVLAPDPPPTPCHTHDHAHVPDPENPGAHLCQHPDT